MTRLKGEVCGNPALQGGGDKHVRAGRLEDGTRLKGATGLDGDSSQSSVFQTGCLGV